MRRNTCRAVSLSARSKRVGAHVITVGSNAVTFQRTSAAGAGASNLGARHDDRIPYVIVRMEAGASAELGGAIIGEALAKP